MGPSLYGIIGRSAGSVDGFTRYSDAIRASGIEWTDETLKQFLSAPQKFLSGTSMPFAGIASEKDIDDLLGYLKTVVR